MATSSSDRRKRKYGEGQKSRTEKNRAKKQRRADATRARLINRTQALVGQHVAVRAKDHAKPLVGTVLEVLRKGDEGYPEDSKRRYGAFLKVRTGNHERIVSRHRVKPIRENHS